MSNGVERVWLVQTPSLSAYEWRAALQGACVERGWQFAIHERGSATPVAEPGRPLLVVAWLNQAEGIDVTHWAVQLSSPLEVLERLKSQGDLSDHDAFYEASLRLATAWALVENGAITSWSRDPEIEIPGLGRVTGPTPSISLALVDPPPDHPLSMFEPGPLAGGKTTRWGQDLFLYPDARPSEATDGYLSLVGRRRLLFNGPNIFLPPGRWRFSAELSIQPPGRTELLVEWGYGYEVVSLTTPVEIAGRYELLLEKQWTDVQPADFRISLMIPALEGEFTFHGGVLSRLDG